MTDRVPDATDSAIVQRTKITVHVGGPDGTALGTSYSAAYNIGPWHRIAEGSMDADQAVQYLDPAAGFFSLTWQLFNDWRHLDPTDTPERRGRARGPKNKTYSHPAQWHSDNASDVVGLFTEMYNKVADVCGEPGLQGSERARMAMAVQYLHEKADLLPRAFDAEFIKRLIASHLRLADELGLLIDGDQPTDVRCPNCNERYLSRPPGVAGEDHPTARMDMRVRCECGFKIDEDGLDKLSATQHATPPSRQRRTPTTRRRPNTTARTCQECQTSFQGRADQRFCSAKCKQKDYRRRRSTGAS